MSKRLCTLTLMLLTAWLLPAQAQKPENNWERLGSLRVGQKVLVVDMDLQHHKGTFLAYAEDALSIRTGQGDRGFQRDRVLRVQDREHSRRLRNTLIGAAIGAGIGLAVGAAVDTAFTETGEKHTGTRLFTPLGAGAGAGIGAAVPSYQTIYRAPKRAAP